jgi:uncharacterized membrane protein
MLMNTFIKLRDIILNTFKEKSVQKWIPDTIIILFGILYIIMVICNHYFFRTWTWDYGSYNFAFCDYAHFHISDNPLFAPHISFLQDHVSFTFMLFIPLYWLLNWLTGTYTLSLIQTFIILYGGWAVYKLIEFRTSDKRLIILALLLYFALYGRWASFCSACNLAIIGASMIPVLLYYFEKKKFLPAALVLAFIFLTREDMPLWTFFIGIFLLMTHYKDKKYRIASLLLILLSLGYFLFTFKVIIPLLETPYKKYDLFNYAVLGKNPYEAIVFIATHPLKTLELLFVNHSGKGIYDSVKFEFYYVYFLCGGFLLFYRPKYLLLFIPLVAKKMFNDDPIRWSIESYYSIETVSILPIAVCLIISEIKNAKRKNILIAIVLFCSLGVTTFKLLEKGRALNYDNTNFAFYKGSMYHADFNVKKVNHLLKLIPSDAKVSASGTIVPHLAYRPVIYYFPKVDDAEYIAVFTDKNTYPLNKMEFENELNKYSNTDNWTTLLNDFPLLILKKEKKSQVPKR